MANERKTIVVPVDSLVPGMIAARDVYSKNDQLLIAAGSRIDESAIARITFFGIVSVAIFVEEAAPDEPNGGKPTFPDEKEEFRQFSKKYRGSLMSVMTSVNKLLAEGNDIDEEKLVTEVTGMVESTDNKFEVFNMIHYLRNFDDETYMHSVNVSMICNVFADWLGMSEEEKKILTLCGLLHDIGKLLINKTVLRKKTRLTEEEYEIIKEHPQKGYDFLKDKDIDERIKQAVLLHHERCNGQGYPRGVGINEIDAYSAITAIADVYDAMTSNRIYRRALCPFEVVRLFEEEGRQQFNPNYLVPIIRKLTDCYLQHEVLLSDGQRGRIILNNPQELSRPSILTKTGIVDLAKNRNIVIAEVL